MGNKLAAIVYRRLFFLTSNPAEFLNKERTDGSSSVFGPLQSTLEWVLADGYKMLMALGFGVVGCCLVAAFICFGVMKDSAAIKDNKNWIMRLLITAAGISVVIGLIGIFSGIGSSINSSSVTPTP